MGRSRSRHSPRKPRPWRTPRCGSRSSTCTCPMTSSRAASSWRPTPSTSWPRRARWPSCSPRPARSGAAPGRRRSGGSRGDRLDYTTLEHAGKPHKGKITDTEKQLVHDHLDEINERLTAQGLRTISLTDPEHVERYDLQRSRPGAQHGTGVRSRGRDRDRRRYQGQGGVTPGAVGVRPYPCRGSAVPVGRTADGLGSGADRGAGRRAGPDGRARAGRGQRPGRRPAVSACAGASRGRSVR